jgi:hypothetical protein
MSILASGCESACAFDPAIDTHFAISEQTQCALHTLARALASLAQISDTPLDETGPTLCPADIAPLFWVMSAHADFLLSGAVVRFPRQEAA